MGTFKQDILYQIAQIENGKIFTFRDLSFPYERLPNVTVILSEQSIKGELEKVKKGAFYKPQKSTLGFGNLPIYQDEQLRFIAYKLDGYFTGAYIYNKLGITEQTATTITIATKKPFRRFTLGNLEIECVKAYSDKSKEANSILYLRLLDAIKDIKHIPGCMEQDVYDRIKKHHLKQFEQDVLTKIVLLAQEYPPRVRKILGDMLGDLHFPELQIELARTISPTTRFELNYHREY